MANFRSRIIFFLIILCTASTTPKAFGAKTRVLMESKIFKYYADHLFLFYTCGRYLYINHESRSKRIDTSKSFNFSIQPRSTYFLKNRCASWGDRVSGELAENSPIAAVANPNSINIYYKTKWNTIQSLRYTGRPTAGHKKSKWLRRKTLRDQKGNILRDIADLKVISYKKKHIIIYKTTLGVIKVVHPNGTSQIISATGTNHLSHFDAAMAYHENGNRLVVLWEKTGIDLKKNIHLSSINLDQFLLTKKISQNIKVLSPAMTKSTAFNLTTELSGKLELIYNLNGTRLSGYLEPLTLRFERGIVEEKIFRDEGFGRHEDDQSRMVQIPLGCIPGKSCELYSFYYSKNSSFAHPFKLLHWQKAGHVEMQAQIMKVHSKKRRLIGIIEGPPPVPKINIKSTLKSRRKNFHEIAMLRIQRQVRVRVTQRGELTTIRDAQANSTTMYSVKKNAQVPFLSAISMGGMAGVESQIGSGVQRKSVSTYEESFTCHLAHVVRSTSKGDENIMAPIGKLVFLTYDIQAYQYKFIDKYGMSAKNSPVLYTMIKKNLSTTTEKYDIIAQVENPLKFKHKFIVGDLESYQSKHRLASLHNRMAELNSETDKKCQQKPELCAPKEIRAPESRAMSFSYNNELDHFSSMKLEDHHSKNSLNKENFFTEYFGSLGFGEKFMNGVNVSAKFNESMTYTWSNEAKDSVAISLAIPFVTSPEDVLAKAYDFKVWYLRPSEKNAHDLFEELRATKNISKVNARLLESIDKSSKPWLVTYSVSNIRQNQ